jgi:hypothetical protein
MLPRTKKTALAHVAASMKRLLDAVLRSDNEARHEAHLELLKDRDKVLIARERGAYWRTLAHDVASETLALCEAHLANHTYRGALDTVRYLRTFGVTEFDGVLTPRKRVAASVLESFQNEQVRMCA